MSKCNVVANETPPMNSYDIANKNKIALLYQSLGQVGVHFPTTLEFFENYENPESWITLPRP